MHLQKGTSLLQGKYIIEEVLGQGGFGITYLAAQTCLNRRVAIKEFFIKDYCGRDNDTKLMTISNGLSNELVEQYKRKFIKEAQTIGKLDNPHIIHIHDVFEENETVYYVMEYLSGGNLSDRIPQYGMNEAVAIKIIKQIGSALIYIHNQNILHLDIKPKNILFRNDDTVVLIDFGISKHYYAENGGETSTTPSGVSEGYAPLEQYENGGITNFSPATDIYALGATFYHLLVGKRPPSAIEVIKGLPTLPSSVALEIAHAISIAMKPIKEQRPQSVNDFFRLMEQKQPMRSQTGNKNKNSYNIVKRIKTYIYSVFLIFVGLLLGIGVNYIINLNSIDFFVAKDDSDYLASDHDTIITPFVVKEEPDNQEIKIERFDLAKVTNGVYAIDKNGKGVYPADADTSCVAVALIVNDAPVPQRIFIEKYEHINPVYIGYKKLPWGHLEDVVGIYNYANIDGNEMIGALPFEDSQTYYFHPVHFSADYLTWTAGALSNFSGAFNTDKISKISVKNNYMTAVLKYFNSSRSKHNLGFSDWYIPSMGQLALIFLNRISINSVLRAIGGVEFSSDEYWSSTEWNENGAWYINFKNGICQTQYLGKKENRRVRFIRHIK